MQIEQPKVDSQLEQQALSLSNLPSSHRPLSSRLLGIGEALFRALSKPGISKDSDSSGCGCAAYVAIVTLTGAWALVTGQPESPKALQEASPLPAVLKVKSTTLPSTFETITDPDSGKREVTQVIHPAQVDFDEDFELETDRYKIIKHNDSFLTRWIGHIGSIPTKLFFWDSRAGWGIDGEGTKNIIAMLERDKEVSGLTVRINHNQVFQDTARAYSDPRAKERNGWFARTFWGVPSTFIYEFFMELSRGDYYNPMTGTTSLYSNIPALSAHEVGHHKDFARFKSDALYDICAQLPIVNLYPEAQASIRAHDELLTPNLRWQGLRYLVPAYGTYLLAAAATFIKLARKFTKD